jgi:hypothetical protein
VQLFRCGSKKDRALRASVLRLWTNACLPEPPNLEDMIRFSKAIDQALAAVL